MVKVSATELIAQLMFIFRCCTFKVYKYLLRSGLCCRSKRAFSTDIVIPSIAILKRYFVENTRLIELVSFRFCKHLIVTD